MLKKLNFVEVLAPIQNQIKTNTGTMCYDFLPLNPDRPCYAMEIVGQEPVKSKTMFREKYHVVVHAFSDGKQKGSVPIAQLVQNLDEALTENIELPEGYTLINQEQNGLQRIQEEVDESKHAILSYTFDISYGFKMKI